MEIRKTTSVALAAVAAAAFTLPTASFAKAQAAPAPAGQSIASCTPGKNDLKLEVSSTKLASIEEALKIAQECSHRGDITIHVVSDPSTPAVLPATIPAGFSRVVITGLHDRNAVLAQADNGSTVVMSPTEIRYADIHVNGGDVPALISHTSLVVSDSAITGNGLLVGDNVSSRQETAKASVSLVANQFDRAGAINTGRGYEAVKVIDNTFNADFSLESGDKHGGIEVVRGTTDILVLAPTANTRAVATIAGNRFIARGVDAGVFVTVMRPNVTITNNTFKSEALATIGVRYEVPSVAGRNRYAFATNIDVNKNTFVLAHPVVQDQKTLPRPNSDVRLVNGNKEAIHVRISNNRFIATAEPELVFALKARGGEEMKADRVVLTGNAHMTSDPSSQVEEHETILEED